MNILVADSSELAREKVIKVLGHITNSEVTGTGTISETLDFMNTGRFEVIVMDIQFPDGFGTEILDSCTAYKGYPIVIVFTNHANIEYRRECLRKGALYFLDKSVHFHMLPEIIKKLAYEYA